MKNDLLSLRKIGLSPAAALTYLVMDREISGPAVAIAVKTGQSRSTVYRALKELEEYGFVISLKAGIGVTYFYSEPLERALVTYAHWQRSQVLEILKHQADPRIVVAVKVTD